MTARGTLPALLACAALACGGPAGPVDFAIDSPRAGSAVSPGQEVRFRLAVEGSRNTAYELSLAGRAVGRAEGSGVAIIPWTVPAGLAPGQQLDFTATARDTVTGVVASAATHLVVAGAAAAADEQWTGAWTGRATGARMYDDEAAATFEFTVAPDGRLAGQGTATLRTHAVKAKACTYVHAQTPSEFPIAVSGRREGDAFALRIEGPGMVAQRTISPSCASPGPPALHDAFGMAGIHAAGLAPRVPARDGGEAAIEADVATLKARYRTTVRRK